MPEYRIKNWDKNFENNRTRELKRMEWVPVPNRMDTDSYTELVDHPNAASHLGAWIAMVEIASRRSVRGTLPQGSAGISQALARISRLPSEVFDEVIPRLLRMGWIEEYQTDIEISQVGAGKPHHPAEKSQDGAPRAHAGMEGNGIEGDGTEEKRTEETAGAAPFLVPKSVNDFGIEGWDALVEAGTAAGMSLDPDPQSKLCQNTWRYRSWENRQSCIQGIWDRIKCGQYSREEARYVPSLRNYVTKDLWRESMRPRDHNQPNKKEMQFAKGLNRICREAQENERRKVYP